MMAAQNIVRELYKNKSSRIVSYDEYNECSSIKEWFEILSDSLPSPSFINYQGMLVPGQNGRYKINLLIEYRKKLDDLKDKLKL